jgi:PiT family inorganic phosphate transporter
VTSTIKNGIISIDRFTGNPGALMLAMGCAGEYFHSVSGA